MIIKNPKNKGFTLIELLVVIAIIGILSVFVQTNLNSARVKARDAKRKIELIQLRTALELYYLDNQKYPALNCISAPNWNCWGVSGQTVPNRLLPEKYISAMPQDPNFKDNGNACASPSDGSNLYGYFSPDGVKYILAARLEREDDSSINYNGQGGGCTNFANYAIKVGSW